MLHCQSSHLHPDVSTKNHFQTKIFILQSRPDGCINRCKLQEGYLDTVRQLKYWPAQFILAIPASPFLRVILSLYFPNFSSLSFLFSLSPYLPISRSAFKFPHLPISLTPCLPISTSFNMSLLFLPCLSSPA